MTGELPLPPRPLRLFCALDAAAPASWPDGARLEALREAGFDALIAPHRLWPDGPEQGQLADLAQAARAAGLVLVVEADPARFPLGHPLVERQPEAFALRRTGDTDGPIDPRTAMPATGEAIARFGMEEHRALFVEELAEQLASLADAGVAGCRIAPGARVPAGLLKALATQLRGEGTQMLFIAGPPGADRAGLAELGRAGCDYLVSSFAWWDCSAPWLAEELAALATGAPVLNELSAEPADPAALATRLKAAAALGEGVIVPQRMALDLARTGELPSWSEPVSGEGGPDKDRAGPLHRLSASGSPVTALLRPHGPELRGAGSAELVAINNSGSEQPLDAGTLSQVGAEFTASLAPTLLQPGEVRTIALRRARPIAALPSGRHPPRDPVPALDERPRLVIEALSPSVEGGDFAVKRVVGDVVSVAATVYADGHEQLAAELLWRPADERQWSRVRMEPLANDRWQARFKLSRMGRHVFAVEGWLDRFGGYRRDFRKKVDAGVAQPVDRAEGRQLVGAAIERLEGERREALRGVLAGLERASEDDSVRLLLSDELAELMALADDRPHLCHSQIQQIDAERIEARFSSWYELFPRSITDDKARHGTFADVIGVLPHVRDMGFDTLYFPPIHPIGTRNRKGPNNTLTPGPDDPGSPYAIGGAEGGHDALHPELGSFADFAALVEAAHQHGLEIALDFAIQCAPDHPWLKEHPGWFAWRPDGSMKYAENPPKKYQDIVNVDFYAPDAVPGLWEGLRDVVLLWVRHGVKTFRVDNPHTKPLPFWEWMIGEVRRVHPEVIFLSEAFTRPTMMYRLAKVGFSQSYTYFTWRDGKAELIEYITELTTTAPRDFYRPHFFVNTPDINPHFLQTGGRPAHRIRAVLAATLSGLWGVYSGFELCEATPMAPGKEEYLDSEKYEVRPYRPRAPGDIVEDVTLLNRLRRAHPALQTHLNTRFYNAHNDQVIWYGKPEAAAMEEVGETLAEMIMVMVNLDPHHAQDCAYELPLYQFGLSDDATIAVEDLAGGGHFDLQGKHQQIRLDPAEPYRIWRLSVPGEAA